MTRQRSIPAITRFLTSETERERACLPATALLTSSAVRIGSLSIIILRPCHQRLNSAPALAESGRRADPCRSGPLGCQASIEASGRLIRAGLPLFPEWGERGAWEGS